MTHTTAPNTQHEVLSTQEIALHMIASEPRVLLMICTPLLAGEVAAGPPRPLIADRRHNHNQLQAPAAEEAN